MYSMEPIGRIRSCFTEKFGIPKQAGLVPAASAHLELLPPYNREEMVKGLDEFSHLWLQFIFHQTVAEGYKPTVRPPRLGGQKRVGVFASRSPHRPNHLGMSVVRLEKVTAGGGRVILELSGVDLLDGTPVVDIKPYIPYSDAISDADCGYTRLEIPSKRVILPDAVAKFCSVYRQQTGRELYTLIEQTLASDPRPASQRTVGREYGILLWDVNVRWKVMSEECFEVLSCSLVD